MMAFESFVEAGIRRNAVSDALEFLSEHSQLESDGQASHPLMPRVKRRNKGPKRSNGYPPDLQDETVKLLLERAETLSAKWAVLDS